MSLRIVEQDEKTGIIIDRATGDRMVAFQSKTFLSMLDHIYELLGAVAGSTVIHQMGLEIGRTGFNRLKDRVKSEEDMITLTNLTIAARGWGNVAGISRVDKTGLTYIVTAHNHPISGKHAENEPICNLFRGVFTGIIEGFLNKKATSDKQTACVALGAATCIFEINFI